MQCYTELLPSTAVTHAVALPFLHGQAKNLVVAKTSLLQVFALQNDHGQSDKSNGASALSVHCKLVLIGEYPLSGTVTALSSVKTLNSKSGGSALLVATREARLSLVEWDPQNHRISTISIHYYEGENIINQPFGPALTDCSSILSVDPSSRCAALKFGQRHLAILPFRQLGDELLADGEDAGFDAEMTDAPDSGAPKSKDAHGKQNEADSEARQTPYKSSFVLPLTALDPAFKHPVDLAFLHEYREPTFGVLSSEVVPSSALLEERKDCLTYHVITLDLDQRASTGLISVPNLPSDLWRAVPLPLPVGGVLLVGANELIHVDQGGKTTGVAVNEFAKQATNFTLTDQSVLGLKLERCQIEHLGAESGDMLISLDNGSLVTLSFNLAGRNVGGLRLAPVQAENGGHLIDSSSSCTAMLDDAKVFIGSEDGDSKLVGWTRSTQQPSRKRSHAQMTTENADVDADVSSEEDEDDDLYANTAASMKREQSPDHSVPQASTAYRFQVLDSLLSAGPINDMSFTKSGRNGDKLKLVAATGRGRASGLTFMSKEITPQITHSRKMPSARGTWSICARPKPEDSDEPVALFDNLFFAYDGEVTKVYDLNAGERDDQKETESTSSKFVERTGTEFERDGETLAISTLADGTQIVQCRRTEIITYDHNLGLVQMIPMTDDETDAELKILHASFCDPYMLVLRDDSSVQVLKAEKSGELEMVEPNNDFASTKWLSACLYSGVLTFNETAAFMLGPEGAFQLYKLPELTPYCSLPNVTHLPPVISQDSTQRRLGAKETLTEVLVADLGPTGFESPYMILRSASDDLTLYEPFRYPSFSSADRSNWTKDLRFRKVPFNYLPKYDESSTEEAEGNNVSLRALEVAGHNAVLVPGAAASLMLREADSLPKVLALECEKAQSLTPVHWADSSADFTLLNSEGQLQECKLPQDTEYGTGWSVHKTQLGNPPEEVQHISYHEDRHLHVVASCRNVDYFPSEEDGPLPDKNEEGLHPQIQQYTLHLLSGKSHQLLHSFPMPYAEIVTSLKVMTLEVSEHSREKALRVAVGSAVHRGEDLPTKGFLTVFEVLDVVPEPDMPETGVKLSVVAREETKGPVTTLESFPYGLVGIAQGQKLMIRGLREEGSCLPVAFLDAQAYTSTLKTLGKSGLWMAGDAWKGLWFGGFTEEPYKLSVLGKSRPTMEIMSAEFLPYDGELYILIIDADMDLHVLQYDPENPKSLSGSRLLHRSTFHLGHFPTSMHLVPSSLAPFTDQPMTNGNTNGDTEHQDSSLFHVLMTFQSGAAGLVTPLDEGTYRRLGALQTHLTSILEHPAGLNPRAYRTADGEGLGARGVIDGGIIQRISELGSARRAEVLGRAGGDAWGLRSDLEIIGGGGLAYL
ncbi:hypothetical protein MBLNU230_g3763t1 [Neophaeotheca triangularis]